MANPASRAVVPALGLLLAACSPGEQSGHLPSYGSTPAAEVARPRELLLGVRLTRRPERFFEVYQPLVDDLNRELADTRFRLDLSRSDAALEDKLREGRLQLAIANPFPAVRALQHGYRIVARIGRADTTRGVIVVRRDAAIRHFADLKGRAMSVPEENPPAGLMLTRWTLRAHGIDFARDLDLRRTGSSESSLLSVYYGRTSAGTSALGTWRAFMRGQPDHAAHMEVRWQTAGLPGNALIVHQSLPEALARRIRARLFALYRDGAGKVLLARADIDRIEPADRAGYAPVRDFVRSYEAVYGRVEESR